MKNRRFLVLGIVLVLLAIVASVAFAGVTQTDGVWWLVIKGSSPRVGEGMSGHYMEMVNFNDYAVKVTRRFGNGSSQTAQHNLDAGETIHVRCWPDSTVIRVEKK
jgi:hypothetical protein